MASPADSPTPDAPRKIKIREAPGSGFVRERFAPPDREPDFHAVRDFVPSSPYSEGVKETIWTPAKTELGQHRFVTVRPEGAESMLDCNRFLHIETLAAAGMREVFERFGLHSYLEVTQDTKQHGVPATTRSAGVTFPSSEQLQQRADAFAAQTSDSHTKKLEVALTAPGKFTGMKQIGELAEGRLAISTEQGRPVDDMYEFDFYLHDLKIHLPAWACQPPTITTAVCEEARAAIAEYRAADASDSWQRFEAAKTRIGSMTDLINGVMATPALTSLVEGTADNYGEMMCELLRRGTPRDYEQQILRHVANPDMRDVLVAGRR
jgi:hypothetical protein